jgi:hypothetical protein
MKRAAIYLRVSTSKQDTENQRRELEAVAARSSWQIVKVYEDAGISGAKGRDKRAGMDAMLKAVNAKEFEIVAAWSVDRLGRSLARGATARGGSWCRATCGTCWREARDDARCLVPEWLGLRGAAGGYRADFENRQKR